MKKAIIVALITAFLAFMVSCGVSPEEAMENIQNPKISVKTTLKIPVVATSVNTGEIVEDYVEDIDFPGLEIVKGVPVVLRYSTEITVLSEEQMSEINDQIGDISGSERVLDYSISLEGLKSINEKVSVKVPSLGDLVMNIDFQMPNFSEQSLDLNVPGIPIGEYPLPGENLTIPVSAASVSMITVDGAIILQVDFPEDWTSVKLMSVDATLMYSDGEVIESGRYDSNDGKTVEMPLGMKDIKPENLVLEYVLNVENTGAPIISSGIVTISIIPEINVKALKGLQVNVEETVDLPESVKAATFTSGRVIIESEDLEFSKVEGSDFLGVEDGKIVVDLAGRGLPLEVRIDSVDATIVDDISDGIDLIGRFENVKADAEIEAKIGIEEEIPLPASVVAATFTSGEIVMEAKGMEILEVNGSDFLKVEDGKLVVDLAGMSLPITVDIASVNAIVRGIEFGEPFDVEIVGTPEDLRADVEIEVGDELSVKGEEELELPEEAKYLKSILFSSGNVEIIYDSDLPVNVNVLFWSPNVLKDSAPLEVSSVIYAMQRGSISIDLSGYEIVPSGTTITFYYEASPSGYDGENLTIEDLDLQDEDIGIVATVSYGNFGISRLVLGDLTVSMDATLDLSKVKDMVPEEAFDLLKGLKISASLTSSIDVDATLKATITDSEGELKKTLNADMKGKEILLDDLMRDILDLLSESPTSVVVDGDFELHSATVDMNSPIAFGFEAEAPLEIYLATPVEILEYSTTVKAEIPGEVEITGATLTIEGTNTSGMNLSMEVFLNGERAGYLKLDESISGEFSLNEDDFQKLAGEGLPVDLKLYLSEGTQTVSTEGGIDVVVKLAVDVIAKTEGGE